MKIFFKTFILCFLPLFILSEFIGIILPKNYPFGIVIISNLFVVLIGSIIAISVLKTKYQLVNFRKSLLAGVYTILIAFLFSSIVYFLFHLGYKRTPFIEMVLIFFVFSIAQICVLLIVLLTAGMWYAFEKAGEKGFAIFIPIYNIIVMLRISQKPVWWVFMFLIPLVNLFFMIPMLNSISKNFGKTEGFTIGLIFLNGVFWAILGYGDAKYLGTQRNPI